MTENVLSSRAGTPAIALAAVSAVVFWSLKPIFISMIGDRGDYAEVYVAAGLMALIASVVVAALYWRRTKAIVQGGRSTWAALGWAGISGVFLAMWYYGFYRALYGTAKADATIIAFTWPLIAAFAIRLISPSTAGKLKPNQWMLIIASFIGAAAIGVANVGSAQGEYVSGEIIWAFVAALGSGLYLPFAIKATQGLEQCASSKPLATFYAISVANTVSLAVVLSALYLTDYSLRFYAFDLQVLMICALIGLGTYLVAEVTWTWAFQEYKSLTLSSLPYFSPALSVILLNVFFDEPVMPIAIVGLVIILFSNLTLHANQRSSNALSLSLIATVYVALASQILPTDMVGSVPELAAALTGLFAILTGFILSRAAGRRTQEVDCRAQLVRRFVAVDSSDHRELADSLLRALLDLEFAEGKEETDQCLAKIRRLLADQRIEHEGARESARDAFSAWLAIHQDRLSMGENAALWLTGIGSVVFVLLLRDISPFGAAGSIVFAAGAFLAIFTIRDYDRNNLHGFHNQLRRLQQGFREIGKPYYAPAAVIDAGQISPADLAHGIRREVGDGRLKLVQSVPSRRLFNSVYLGTASLVILAVMVFPLATFSSQGINTADAPRPGVAQGEETGAAEALVIADPGWEAGTVVSEIVRVVLEEAGVSADVEPMDHTAAISELASDDPSVHVHPDLWQQNQSITIQESIEEGVILLGEDPYQASQGIYILDSEETEDRVDDLDSLMDPEVAELFDADGDGSGEMWIGARGWATTEYLHEWLESEFGSTLVGEVYSETIFKARLVQEAEAGQPLIFYGYVPDGIHAEFDIRRLDDVPMEAAEETVDVYVARSGDVSESSLTAERILSRISFDEDDINSFITSVNEGVSTEDVAQQWLSDNSERVASWSEGE